MKIKKINRILILLMVIFTMAFLGCSNEKKEETSVTDKKTAVTDKPADKEEPVINKEPEKETDVSEKETGVSEKETDDPETDIPKENDQDQTEEGSYFEEDLIEYFKNYEVMEQPKKNESHYQYNMRAISRFDKECRFEDIEIYWNDFLDAVTEGRTTFKCPNIEVYRFIEHYMIMWNLPQADEWIEMQRNPKFKNGMASFSYKISDEERKEKLEQIKKVTEDVLNEVLEDDYSDFEKALALYIYFVDNYTYLEDMDHWGGIMHVLTQKHGICSEFSRAYSYLLVQAGVDATTVGDFGHSWSFVKIGDKYYHVDVTWGLDYSNLSNFMMTTTRKLETSGDDIYDMSIDKYKDPSLQTCGFDTEDDYFAALWNNESRIKWDRKAQKIYVGEPFLDGEQIDYSILEIDYSEYMD